MGRLFAGQRLNPLRRQPALTRLVLRNTVRPHSLPLIVPLLVVVALCAFVLSAIPRYVNFISDAALQRSVGDAFVQRAGVSLTSRERIAPRPVGDPFATLDARGQRYNAALPASVNHVVTNGTWLAESPIFDLVDENGVSAFASQWLDASLVFRYEPNAWNHVSIVAGRSPAPHSPILLSEFLGEPVAMDGYLPVLEVALSQHAASNLNHSLGDRFLLRPRSDDELTLDIPGALFDVRAVAEIVAVIEVPDETDPFWCGDPRVSRADTWRRNDFLFTRASVLLAPDQYTDVFRFSAPIPWRYTWRYPSDPARFEQDNTDAISTDVGTLAMLSGTPGDPEATLDLRTDLPALIDLFLRQRALAIAILAFSAAAITAIGVGLVLLLGLLVSERRRFETRLTRSRGASAFQLVSARLSEAALIACPAAAIGLLASLLIPGRASNWSLALAVAVAIGATIAIALATVPISTAPLHIIQTDRPGLGAHPRRVTVEVATIAIALVGVYLIRRRGFTSGDASEPVALDPYVIAVPILVAIAAGLVLLRAMPLALRAASTFAAHGRTLVLFLGLRRASARSPLGHLPFMVVLAAAALAVFSGLYDRSIATSQRESVWQQVGADLRIEPLIEGGQLGIDESIATIPGVEAAAPALLTTAKLPGAATTDVPDIQFLAIDPNAAERITAASPQPHTYPATLRIEQFSSDIGSDMHPIPAVLSSTLVEGPNDIAVGDTLTVSAEARHISIIVSGSLSSLAGLDPDAPFIVIPYDAWEIATAGTANPNLALVRTSSDDTAQVAAEIATLAPDARIIRRDEVLDDLRGAPLTVGIVRGFRISALFAATAAILAVVSALAVSARLRAREISILRTLGISPRGIRSLLILESTVPASVAVMAGAVVGIATARLIAPGLDISSVTGISQPGTLTADWFVALLIFAMLITLVGAVVLFSVFDRRIQLGQSLRLGDE